MIRKHRCLQFSSRFAGAVLAAYVVAAAPGARAQVRAQPPGYPVPGGGVTQAPQPQLQLPPLPAATPITPNGSVVEDVVARVNDQIITRSEYARAQQQLMQEAHQENVPESEAQAKLHDLLRDMIDQQLLLSKGKELGITGDTETMRRLDDIRKQNHMDSMEALQKAAEQQGYSFEDFKQQIRNQVISNNVVQEEVGRHLNLTRAEEEAYYKEHAKDFEVPEQVHLSEILIPTPESATDAQVSAAQQKADDVETKLKAGAAFVDTAKASSGGPTASAGGDLGDFKRGALGDVLEKATFSLPAGGYTEPIRTRQGFVILKVDSHQQAGVPPLADVERQVQEAIYFSQLQPALRTYLTKAREDAYIDIKPGFVDTGSSRAQTKPEFTAYAPPPVKKKTVKKERVEQEKSQRAKEDVAAAREKAAAKQEVALAANTAGQPGAKKASRPSKPKKIHREKIRYGQAPRKALPSGTAQTAETENNPTPLGQTAGAAMAPPTESVTTITTGTGVEESSIDGLAPKPVADHKTRFTDREKESEVKRAQDKLAKAEVKATKRPVAPTVEETADEKTRAAPLGLNGNTAPKKHKVKRAKDQPKERLQDKPKPVETTPAPPAPTVNPALGTTPAPQTPAPSGQSPTSSNPQ
jgi:peptidyl-prolyl cis-trans isomerase SurA